MFGENPLQLVHPLAPVEMTEGIGPLVVAKLALWLNWVLVLVNLLPAFPFDGGVMLRSLLWKSKGYYTSVLIVALVAKLVAIVLAVAALWMLKYPVAGPLPAWAPLALLSLLLYFCAKQEVARLDRVPPDEDYIQFEFSAYGPVDAPPSNPPSLFAQWRRKRRMEKERRRREREASDEARVDEILARLHQCGRSGLSAEEHAILQRVSVRYRNRQRS
jgi:hypothetical protein